MNPLPLQSHMLVDGRTITSLAGAGDEAAFLYREIFLERTYFRRGITLSGERPVVVDVGAHIGLFTLYVLEHWPDARIIAVEPVSECCAAFRLNTAGLSTSVTLMERAASRAGGPVRLRVFPALPSNSTLCVDDADAQRVVLSERYGEELVAQYYQEPIDRTVPSVTLAEVMEESALSTVDLLKVDVEGSEMEVLGGLDQPHWPGVKQVVLEVRDSEHDLEQVTSLLRGRGYAISIRRPWWIPREVGQRMVYARRA